MIRLSELSVFATAIIKSLKRQIHNIMTLLIAVPLFIVSCEEDPATIGEGILPGADFDSIVAVDTMHVEMYTLFTDSATSMIPSTSYLGSILDPYFGLTSSDFVSQLWLTIGWPGDGITSIDSVRLYLDVSKVKGEMLGSGTFNIYELAEKLSPDSTYLVGSDVPVNEMLASIDFGPLPEGSDSLLKLDLPISFGEYLLRDTSMIFLGTDTVDFRDYFYGLYFEYPQVDNYHMLELDLIGADTYIVVYYTNASDNSKFFEFLINAKCFRYNRFLHDYEQAEPDKKINYINEPVKDTLAYVQPMEGVYSRLSIPGLEALRSMPGRIAVNKARIYLPVYLNETDYTEDMVPGNILVRFDSAGVKRLLPDYYVDSDGTFLDGTYSKVTDLYKVNIANFVQEYIERKIADPVIEVYLPELGTQNLIVKANRGSDEGVRFELTYTVLKEE
ncbi:MAG: DUF4270 family protein [Bacteroidales bacterium]|nr:DUF4270 family protein [Bacteroidales bacterium]